MLFQELAEPVYCSVSTFKFDGAVLAVAWGKVYCGEAFHFVALVWHVVGCGVHLGDHQVLLPLVLLAQSHIIWLQFFTVATPGSVKLNEDILLGIHDDVVKGLSHHNLNWSFVVLWQRLGLDDGFELS